MIERITALVLTFNEKENIGRTLHALVGVQRVVVIDSFSTDETVEIANTFPNVEVVQRKFDDHTAQWNFGLDQIETFWVLSLDADYELSKEVVDEISSLALAEDIAGYSARFLYRIFGRPLRASVYPSRVVLFRKDKSRYVQEGHTQLLRVSGRVVELDNRISHDDRKPLSHWLASQDRYMKIEAPHLLRMPDSQLSVQDRLRKKVFFAPPLMFLYLLFIRGLILAGWPGWYYVAQRTLAELLLSLRLLTERHQMESGDR